MSEAAPSVLVVDDNKDNRYTLTRRAEAARLRLRRDGRARTAGLGAAGRAPVPPIYLIRGASRTPTGPPALVMAPSSL